MKKTVLVAALMACGAGSVMAQSNVTLYGTMDTSIGRGFNQETTGLNTNQRGTSNWGLRGSEDLGGGLKANFHLESTALETDTGGGGNGFTRQSWLGLSGNFGSVMLGRTTTPQSRVMGTFDLNGISAVNPYTTLGQAANGGLTGSRQSNQVQYATPTFSGFSARIGFGFAEVDSSEKKNWAQIAAQYKAGGLTLGAAVQPKSTSFQNPADNDKYRTGYALGAKYQFDGIATVSGLYQQDEQKANGKLLGFGVAVPFGALEVGAQYARIMTEGTPAGAKTALKGAAAYELFANYSLSKRTTLYVIAAGMNEKTKAFRGFERKSSLNLGVTHKF